MGNKNITDFFNVLYLEDDPLVQNMVVDALKKHVSKILTASNGREGLELFHHHPCDLIITDLHMPEVDGLVFIEKVRAINPTIPIVVTSALTDVSTLITTIDHRVDKYILKPFSPDELISVIQMLSRKIVINKIESSNFNIQLLSKELLSTLSNLLRNVISGYVKDVTGKGASRISIAIKDGFIECMLYHGFSTYEVTLSKKVYDDALINSMRKNMYEKIAPTLIKRIQFASGLKVELYTVKVSVSDQVEKITFKILNAVERTVQ